MTGILTKTANLITTSIILAVVNTVALPQADGASIAIINAGFENPPQEAQMAPAPGGINFETPPGWQLYDPLNLIPENSNISTSNVGVWNPSTAFYADGVPQGNNIGAIFLVQAPGSGEVALTQILSTSLRANTRYTLQVKIGNPYSNQIPDYSIFDGFPGYRVQLLAGGAILAEDNNTLNPSEGTFLSSALSFTTLANDPNLGQPLEIRLFNILAGTGREVNFDDVTLDAIPVPEPSVNFVFFLGLATVLKVRRYLKSQK